MAACRDKYMDLMAGVPQIADDFIALRKSAVLGHHRTRTFDSAQISVGQVSFEVRPRRRGTVLSRGTGHPTLRMTCTQDSEKLQVELP